MNDQNHAIINHVIVERARPEDAAELLEFTKIIGAQTDNLTYGTEGVGASVEQEADFLKGLYDSQKEIFLVAKADGKIVGTANFAASQKAAAISPRGNRNIGGKIHVGTGNCKYADAAVDRLCKKSGEGGTYLA